MVTLLPEILAVGLRAVNLEGSSVPQKTLTTSVSPLATLTVGSKVSQPFARRFISFRLCRLGVRSRPSDFEGVAADALHFSFSLFSQLSPVFRHFDRLLQPFSFMSLHQPHLHCVPA